MGSIFKNGIFMGIIIPNEGENVGRNPTKIWEHFGIQGLSKNISEKQGFEAYKITALPKINIKESKNGIRFLFKIKNNIEYLKGEQDFYGDGYFYFLCEDKNKALEIEKAFVEKDIVIFKDDYMGFEGSGLKIVIYSKIPKNLLEKAVRNDLTYFRLKDLPS